MVTAIQEWGVPRKFVIVKVIRAGLIKAEITSEERFQRHNHVTQSICNRQSSTSNTRAPRLINVWLVWELARNDECMTDMEPEKGDAGHILEYHGPSSNSTGYNRSFPHVYRCSCLTAFFLFLSFLKRLSSWGHFVKSHQIPYCILPSILCNFSSRQWFFTV